MTKKEIGDRGEQIAAEFLQNKNYSVTSRNYHSRYGEIDIIAESDKYILFVEVKTRAANSFGTPSEAVDFRKQKKLIATAYDYLGKHPVDKQPRFDVIEVVSAASGNFGSYTVNHLENAFILEGQNGLF